MHHHWPPYSEVPEVLYAMRKTYHWREFEIGEDRWGSLGQAVAACAAAGQT